MEVPTSLLLCKRVLLIWHGNARAETMQEVVESLRQKAGESGAVLLENAERLLMGEIFHCLYNSGINVIKCYVVLTLS